MPAITFTDKDFQGIDPVQDDPMVISVEIRNCIVKKILIDQGNSANILYWNTFKQLGIPEEELTPYSEPLVGFADIQVKYIVVQASTSYNILLGRPSLNAL
uniref:Gag-pol polyprotein n=1 Tax=Cajanus cajan TaxID=3821 RepID=A0A151QZS3_CAJCA|nr:hypothetical protein KK1_043096 [Cajanus cajan]